MKKLLENWEIKEWKVHKRKKDEALLDARDKLNHRLLVRVYLASDKKSRVYSQLMSVDLPFTVRVKSVSMEEDIHGVLEHFEAGVTMADYFTSRGQFEARDVLHWGTGIVRDLEHLYHKGGILHLDIKPENILIDSRKHARLIDFGSSRSDLAKRDLWSEALEGTLAYASPERFYDPNAVGPMTDLYSMSITLRKALETILPQGASLYRRLLEWEKYHDEIAREESGILHQVRCSSELYQVFIDLLWEDLTI